MVDTIYTSKTHILTSWILVVFGVISMLLGFFFNTIQLAFSFDSVPSFRFYVGFTLIAFTVLLPIISCVLGFYGFLKADKLKLVSWISIIFGLIITFLVLFSTFIFLHIIILYFYAGVWTLLLLIFSISCILFGLRELSKIKSLDNKFDHINYEI